LIVSGSPCQLSQVLTPSARSPLRHLLSCGTPFLRTPPLALLLHVVCFEYCLVDFVPFTPKLSVSLSMSRVHSPVFWSQSDRRSIILPSNEPVDETLPTFSDTRDTALVQEHQSAREVEQSPLDLALWTDPSSPAHTTTHRKQYYQHPLFPELPLESAIDQGLATSVPRDFDNSNRHSCITWRPGPQSAIASTMSDDHVSIDSFCPISVLWRKSVHTFFFAIIQSARSLKEYSIILMLQQTLAGRPEQGYGLLRAKKSFRTLRNLASTLQKDDESSTAGQISGIATDGPSNASALQGDSGNSSHPLKKLRSGLRKVLSATALRDSFSRNNPKSEAEKTSLFDTPSPELTSTLSDTVVRSEDRDASVDLTMYHDASLTSSRSPDEAQYAINERDSSPDMHGTPSSAAQMFRCDSPIPWEDSEYSGEEDSNSLVSQCGSFIEDFESPMPYSADKPEEDESTLAIRDEIQATRDRLGLHEDVPIPAPLRLPSTEHARRLACIEEASEGSPSPKKSNALKAPHYMLKPQPSTLQPLSDSEYLTMPHQQTPPAVDKGKGIAHNFASAATKSSSTSFQPAIPPRAPERLSPAHLPTPRSRTMAPEGQPTGGQTTSESQPLSRSRASGTTRTISTAVVLPPPCNPLPPCPGPPPSRPQPPTPAQREEQRRRESMQDAMTAPVAAGVPSAMRASVAAPAIATSDGASSFVARPRSGSSVFGPGPTIGHDEEPKIMTREEARRIALAPGPIIPCPECPGLVVRDFSLSSNFQILEDKHKKILEMRAKAEARRLVARTLRPFSQGELEALGLVAPTAVSPAAAAEATTAGAASNTTTKPEEKNEEEK
ncbi:hypothetical protein F5Y18DRAFT_441932, partial [Xylariaceae sp. FL1019]